MTDEIDYSSEVENNLAVPESRPRNALKHGAFAKTILLPWEDSAELDALHEELRDEWRPVGTMEEDAVATLLDCLWRKRRVRRKRQIEALAALDNMEAVSTEQPRPLFEDYLDRFKERFPQDTASRAQRRDLVSQLLGFSSSLYGKQDMKMVSISIRLLGGESADYLKREVPLENYQKGSDWIRDIKHHVDTILLPKARGERDFEAMFQTTAAELLTEDRILQDIAVEERLDARIDRAIRRLAQMKTMKQIAGIELKSAVQPGRSAPQLQAPTKTE